MAKWAKYTRKYVKEWESKVEFKGWLKKATDEQSANNDFKEAYCSVCKTVLRAHHGDLLSHSKTSKHISKMKCLVVQTQPKLSAYGVSNVSRENKHIDIMLAVHIATHSSIRSIDHLGEMLKVFGKGSNLENLKLHRTKCSKLILNVLSPSIVEDLVKDIGDIGYSLIVDESTDVSVNKYMAYCIRYFSKSKNQIRNEFLGFVIVERATAVALYDGCSTDIEILEIQWRNLTSLRYSDICDSSIPIQEKNTQEFWVDVLNIKETGGKKKFEDLALFVLQILSLPLSNAIVERVFSVMNCVKSKLRNRMQVDMLQAILRIRLHLNASKICCKSFKPTETMFHKFTSDMYDSPKITTSESESVDSATTLDEVMDIFISEGAQEINLYD
ncbi:uncharacterized protein LOC114130437 isoform X1 [Aphis gossypii]|uniref:uncharacterized protein LOC114130437 isoform X1 n=1 Tax=Aphis gossypii TaxID=80765 RepID=UPI002158A43E|nr:uncharacterized protein LOC114130437 isoform X1 [Aphis gossypii]